VEVESSSRNATAGQPVVVKKERKSLIDLDEYTRYATSIGSILSLRQKELEDSKTVLCTLKEKQRVSQQANDILSNVGLLVQSQTRGLLESMTTTALQTVFGKKYVFKIDDKIANNRPESYPYVLKSGRRHELRDDEIGGSVLDIVAFVFRVVIWSISDQKTEPIFLLDEPFKAVDKTVHLIRCGRVIKSMSSMLGVQFIIVTHEEKLMEIADNSIVVTMDEDEISHITQMT
jgi:ABC-type transporter Mla maintaining outer membrane lipid asymmetry ATPase subunit MlaF